MAVNFLHVRPHEGAGWLPQLPHCLAPAHRHKMSCSTGKLWGMAWSPVDLPRALCRT